jgi:sarcosine oxidase, subunit gamma
MVDINAAAPLVRSETPLVRFALGTRPAPRAAGILATERGLLTHVNLRGDPGDGAFLSSVRDVIGVELPIAANTISTGARCVAYWLGPDEWLVIAAPEPGIDWVSALQAAIGERFSAVTDVSGGQTVVVLRGAAVRELLAKDCPLDLHPDALGIGQCAQTRLAKAAVLLRPLADGAMEIVVRRSFADYFWLWLEEAAAEYGLDATG